MRINTAKQRMLEGKPAFGYALGLGSPLAGEILSATGIDFILMDTQHGSFGPESSIYTIMAVSAGAAVPMARVTANNYALIGRLLDEGVLGIVVPMIDTAEDAQTVASACRLPPVGNRSWGWGRARALGIDYPEWINDQLFVAIQLESIKAVENAEAIMSVPGIDGCWVGPADLSLSMGFKPSEMWQREEHRQALEQVVQACRNTGKIPGIAASSPEEALKRAEQGFQFVTAGSDIGFMSSGAMAGIITLGLGK